MGVTAPFRTTVTVVGMTCGHCTSAVTSELTAIPGVRDVEVELSSGAVTVTSQRQLTGPELAAAVAEAGYELVV
jgi:copper chaperone CopZ